MIMSMRVTMLMPNKALEHDVAGEGLQFGVLGFTLFLSFCPPGVVARHAAQFLRST